MKSEFKKDELTVEVFPTVEEMGAKAAEDVSASIRAQLAEKSEVNMIFAAAPSQEAFLARLVADTRIDWTRVNAFHMDEYVGIDPTAPQSFAKFLRLRLFDKVPFKTVNCLDGRATDAAAECARYTKLLDEMPVDIVCLGIGENGHIAFNDPPVADFNDPCRVKVVELDGVCRQQQVNEKCFETLELVPTHALTLTVPALLRAAEMFCIVPFTGKAKAVRATLEGPIETACPASILRTKSGARLYLNTDSASLLS